MDFKSVLSILLKKFVEQDIRYSLIGGFALGLWGVGRTTVDIDFLINRDDINKLDTIMKGLGYECRYRSDNVSQYISPLEVFGEVDFLHAFRETSLNMLGRAEDKEIFNGSLKIKVLKPEDIIGLKLQAIKNNSERKEKELSDIKSLLGIYKYLDWSLIEKYCNILEMDDMPKKMKTWLKK